MSDDRQYPEGALATVTIEVRVPKPATEDQIDEWLRFFFNDGGSCHQDNPLYSCAPEPFGSFGLEWELTGKIGRREEYGHEPTESGGVRYRVKYIRESMP